MYLNIRIVILLLTFSSYVNAQGESAEASSSQTSEKRTYIEIAPYYPIYFGDNYSQAYEFSVGISGGVTFSISDELFLTINTRIVFSDVTNQELVGGIETAATSRIGAGIGYGIDIGQKLLFLPTLQLGYLRHKQRLIQDDLNDEGMYILGGASFYYSIVPWLELHAFAGLTQDFLSTKAPKELESFFKRSNAIPIQLGVAFKL